MLDRVIIKATITEAEAEEIAKCANLQSYIKGGITHYETTNKDRFKDVYILIKGSKLKVCLSVHKQSNLFEYGCLENDNLFTIKQAKNTLYKFIELYKLPIQKLHITEFEIGLNIPLREQPTKHIDLIKSITTRKEQYIQKVKIMLEDANYKQLRQKTSRKDKHKRKYFKVYDKGFEKADRKRKEYNEQEKILRIETTYRRYKIKVIEFFNEKNINRFANTFFNDWTNIEYERELLIPKGYSIIHQTIAKEIESIGDNEYLKYIKEQKSKKLISERQYRTKREFLKRWNTTKHLFINKLSNEEKEFKNMFLKVFNEAIEV